MKAKNRNNVIWLEKKHRHPGSMESPQKANGKYRNHSVVSRTVHTPRQPRRGA